MPLTHNCDSDMRKPVNILGSPKVLTDAPERNGENKVKPGGVGRAARGVVTPVQGGIKMTLNH